MAERCATRNEIERGSHEFRDFDAFRASLRGWDTEPIQISAGSLRLTHEVAYTPGLSLARLRTNQRSLDTSEIEAGGLGLILTLGQKRWCGLDVPPGSLVLIAGGRTHQTVLEAGWESIELFVSASQLEEAGFDAGLARPCELIPERSVFPLPGALVAEVRAWALDLLDPAHPASARELREEALGTVVPRLLRNTWLGSSSGRASLPSHPTPAYGLVARALELAEAAPRRLRSMEQLAAPLGVSRRTLELAFRSSLGCSPSRYFRTRRLGRVRSNLLRGQSVTEAAIGQEFVSLGRFSELYQRQFGELPSDTRRRALPS